MTSHEFAKFLKQLSDIFLALPDVKIEKSLFNIAEIVSKHLSLDSETDTGNKIIPGKKTISKEEPNFDWNNIIQSLKENDYGEAKKILVENPNLNTIAMLSELANKLNVNISGRPKKDSIIHIILKSLERNRLDKTIRSRKKYKESETDKK